MGVIQNSINQALGTIGIASKLVPELEDKAKLRKEERTLTKQEQRLNQAIETLQNRTANVRGVSQSRQAEYEIEEGDRLFDDLINVQREKAKLGMDGFEPLIETLSNKAEYHSMDLTPAEQERNKALVQARANIQAKREQNERIQLFGAHGDVISDFTTAEQKRFPGKIKKKPQGGNQ